LQQLPDQFGVTQGSDNIRNPTLDELVQPTTSNRFIIEAQTLFQFQDFPERIESGRSSGCSGNHQESSIPLALLAG
jgi:hypothetical protein